jgi:hypothetical protein
MDECHFFQKMGYIFALWPVQNIGRGLGLLSNITKRHKGEGEGSKIGQKSVAYYVI